MISAHAQRARYCYLLLVCVTVMVGSPALAADGDDPQAVAALRKLGAKIEGNPAIKVDISNRQLSDDDLEPLGKLSKIQRLTIDAPITNKGLAHLSGLTELRYLFLSKTRTTSAGLVHLKDLTRLDSLDGIGPSGDADMEIIKGFTSLSKLTITGKGFTGAGLDQLKGMTSLTNLHINQCQITDTDLEKLKGLTNVRTLNISQNRITGEGLKYLKDLPLGGLAMYVTDLDDANMEHVKAFTNLGFLDIRGTKVTDAGLEKIAGLTKISYLRLNNTRGITDAGLAHLKGMDKLQILSLSNTRVTDACVAHLKALPGLKTVELERTGMTSAGFKQLREAVPGLTIQGSGAGGKPDGTKDKEIKK
jgi:Leucine-rich repeat (LRR) protein